MSNDYELTHNSVAIKLPDENHDSRLSSIERDEADLRRLGKRPVLKVRFPP